jgi:prevent-host-death family protein
VKTVNIQAAKTHLSRLVEEAVRGEEIVLAKAGRPLVVLTPVRNVQGPRQGGRLGKKLGTIPADFDAASAEVEALFHQ